MGKKKRSVPFIHSTHPAAIRARWRRWLRRIESEIRDLVVARHIYDTVGSIVEANEDARQEWDYHRWSLRNHAISMSVGIRRLLDKGNDRGPVVSLGRMLSEMGDKPSVLTRQSHVSLWRGQLRSAANPTFDRIAGRGLDAVPSMVPKRDLRRLISKSKRVKGFVDKEVAHLDERNLRRRTPDISAIHDAIEDMEKVYRKYSLLLTACDPRLLPTWQYDWTVVFAYPWKPDQQG